MPLPFRTVTVVCLGRRRLRLHLLAERDGRRLLRRVDVGVRPLANRRQEMLSCDVVRSAYPSRPSIRDWKTCPGGSDIGEHGVREHRLRAHVLAATLRDLDVARQRLDHLRQLRQLEVLADLVLEGADEGLLARVAVEVAVGVPEPDERERLVAVQLLVAGLQVDRRVEAVVVVVAAVDVHPDPAELVDDLGEAAEVDRDQVVDRHPGELADGVERPARAAVGVRRVDLRRRTVERPGQMISAWRSRGNESSEIVLFFGFARIEHDRVRARRRALRLLGRGGRSRSRAPSRAGPRWAGRASSPSPSRRRCCGATCCHRLVRVEVCAARRRRRRRRGSPSAPSRGSQARASGGSASAAPAAGRS